MAELLETPWDKGEGRPRELTLREALVVTCGYLRQNIIEDVWAARHLEQEAAIGRSACQYGLAFKKPRNSYSPAHVNDPQPSAMKLIDQCASRTAGVGATYYRLLSSVAHGQMHGLSRFLIWAPAPAEPGKVIAQRNLNAHDTAFHLLVGPLCVSTVVQDLRWYFGWDTETLDPAVTAMLYTWGRIAEVPYPGPELAAFPAG